MIRYDRYPHTIHNLTLEAFLMLLVDEAKILYNTRFRNQPKILYGTLF